MTETPESFVTLQFDADMQAYFEGAGMSEMAARILVVALDLFARKGYAATSVREIVQEANITNPMLYYYFDSKEGLFNQLLGALFNVRRIQMTRTLESGASLAERIRNIVEMNLESCRRAPRTVQFVYAVIFGPEQSRPPIDIVTQHRAMLESIQAVFQAAIDAGEFTPHEGFSTLFLAEQLLGTINHHVMQVIKKIELGAVEPGEGGGIEELVGDEALERLVRFFLAGAGQLNDTQRDDTKRNDTKRNDTKLGGTGRTRRSA